MKEYTERQTEKAISQLMATLRRNWYDTSEVLGNFEEWHSDQEICYSKTYNALSAGHFAIKEAMDRIEMELNKKREPNK